MNTYDIYRLETPEQVVSHQQANSGEQPGGGTRERSSAAPGQPARHHATHTS